MSVYEQAREAVNRISTCLGISQDNSLVLLLAYNWDERKITNFWSLASSSVISSLDLALSRRLQLACALRQASCGVCDDDDTQCQVFECRHAVCTNCIEGHAEAKVVGGELNIRCPVTTCGKMAGSSILLPYLSLDANVVYRYNIEQHFIASTANLDTSVFAHFNETLLAKAFVIGRILIGVGKQIWGNKNRLVASLMLIIVFCKLFCSDNKVTCVQELTLINMYAFLFNIWGHILKTSIACLMYIAIQSHSYTVWIVLALSFTFFGCLIYKMLGGCVKFVRAFLDSVKFVFRLCLNLTSRM